MGLGQTATGTATSRGPAALRAVGLGSPFMCALFAAAFTTSTPAPAAITRYEDTALRSGPRGAGQDVIERQDLSSIDRINILASYQVGWNGPDSIGPTLETVRQAKSFAYQLAMLGEIYEPYISLADDGEINFYWDTKSGFKMDLGFTGTSYYSYFAETSDGREFIEDEVILGKSLPSELIAALRA